MYDVTKISQHDLWYWNVTCIYSYDFISLPLGLHLFKIYFAKRTKSQAQIFLAVGQIFVFLMLIGNVNLNKNILYFLCPITETVQLKIRNFLVHLTCS